MIFPAQEIFNTCFLVCKKIDDNTFTFLPGEETKYPFIFVGEQFNNDIQTKTVVGGKVTQRIHFYHNDLTKRGTITKMMNDILYELRKVKKTRNYQINITDVSSRVLFDNSTENSLIHAVLEIDFNFF